MLGKIAAAMNVDITDIQQGFDEDCTDSIAYQTMQAKLHEGLPKTILKN